MSYKQNIRIPDFKAATREVEKLVQRTLPVKIAAEAEKFFKDSFREQGFTDIGLKPWKPTKSGKKALFGHKSSILQGKGHLKNSIRTVKKADAMVHISAGNQHVPYAKIHNEGGIIDEVVNVKQHKRRKSAVVRVKSSSLKTKRTVTTKRKVVTGYSDVKAHKRHMHIEMPQRQFMGESKWLNDNIDKIIEKEINTLERQLFNF